MMSAQSPLGIIYLYLYNNCYLYHYYYIIIIIIIIIILLCNAISEIFRNGIQAQEWAVWVVASHDSGHNSIYIQSIHGQNV